MPDSLTFNFEQSVINFKGRERAAKLGYRFTADTYLVSDPTNNNYFYARTERSRYRAYNLAQVPPLPDLEVVLKYNDDLGVYIDRFVNNESNRRLIEAVGGSIGRHTHSRYSGMAFLIDARLLQQFSVYKKDDTSLTVVVREGRFDFRGQMYWLPRTELDMAPYVPTNADTQCWAAVCINPLLDPPDVEVVLGPEYDAGPTLTPDLLTQLNILGQKLIPLTGIRLVEGMTAFEEQDFESLYPLVTGWKYDEFADGINRILTDTTPEILFDMNGNVLIGSW